MEQRKLKRRHLVYYLEVMDRNSGRHLGNLVDITTEGLMLVTKERIGPDALLEFRIVLPSGLLGKPYLDLDGKSLWCELDVNPDLFATGFRFFNISEETLDDIEHLIEHYGFND
ncbi:MAG: PilZ domain-containing protein [Pseudomonadota bacterium]